MAITISIVLQKGGVGKSTTAQNLANTLGFKGKKVLLIDLDPQSNVTYSSGVDDPALTITDLLGETCSADDATIRCKYYDLIAADFYLTNVEMAAVESTLLSKAITPLKNEYDFVIIDTPPALGNLSVNALVASDYVIIPTEPRPFALQGIGRLNDTISNVTTSYNSDLKVLGILLIKHHERTILNRDTKDMIVEYAAQMNTKVFDTHIREGVAVAEAQTLRQPLIDYAHRSNPNVDYMELTNEVLRMLGE